MSAQIVDQSQHLNGFPHGFTRRHGGVSVGDLASLNLALRGEEVVERLEENWTGVLQTVGFHGGIERVAILNQVHGAEVCQVEKPAGVLQTVAEADAAVTTRRDVLLGVRTADCVPVLLASAGGVGVAHAGWRGVACEVVPRAVEALCQVTGEVPSQVTAVIGPHISVESYEVGAEVVAGILATGVPEHVFVQRRHKAHVSLASAVRYQLERVGVVHQDQIGGCTFEDLKYFSHRRDGSDTGRLAGVIARPPR